MPARTYQKSFSELGGMYGQSRQGIAYLHKLHAAAILDPGKLFAALVQTGRQSKLRTRLSDPAARRLIAKQISTP
jgi:hypothetical protein